MATRIPLEHLPDKSPNSLRRLSDTDLYKYIAGWKPGTEDHIAGLQEIERRRSRPADTRSWIAIAIAGLALLLSVLSSLK